METSIAAMVPGFVIRDAAGKMRRGRGRKRVRTRDMRRKNVNIARRQNVATCDDGVRAVGNPEGRCIKMTDIATRRIKSLDGNKTDVRGGDIKDIEESQSVAIRHDEFNRTTTDGIYDRTPQTSDRAGFDGLEGAEIRSFWRDVAGGATVEDEGFVV
jgi:hypothetical protein